MSGAASGVPQIALLGDGVAAAEHAAALSAMGCQVRVVLGARSDRVSCFAERHGIGRWTTSLEEALGAESVDAVVIASPSQLHARQAVAAAACGKHVLCEVPLSTSLRDAQAAALSIAEAGVVGMVCQTQRYMPAIDELRRLRESGQLDPLQVLSLTGLRRRRAENAGWQGASREWIDSVLWHHASHAVDTALYLLNDPVETVRASAARPDPDDGRPLDISICLETRSGRLATTTLSYSARPAVSELFVIAEEKTHWVSGGVRRELTPVMPQAQLTDPHASNPDSVVRQAIALQDRAFIDSIARRRVALPTPVEVLPVFEVLAEAERQIEARLATLRDRIAPVARSKR